MMNTKKKKKERKNECKKVSGLLTDVFTSVTVSWGKIYTVS